MPRPEFPLTVIEFQERFATEEACRDYLFASRWPEGFVCAEVHYREWFDLLRERGHRIAGKEPLATFLTQLNRSSGVEPVGRRSGRYRLLAAA